jgi:hypothetical protein
MKKNSSVIEDIMIQEGESPPSDFAKTMYLLMNDEFRRRKTILDNSQVPAITVIDVIAQIYDIQFLQEFITYFAEWRTSGDKGKGRQDIVDISKFQYAEQQKMNEQFMDIMRGKR